MSNLDRSKHYLLRFWAIVGIINFVIGLAGVPSDIETWSNWIDKLFSRSTSENLARSIEPLINFVNNHWVRLLFAISGITMIIWPLRWFWRIRHKLIFEWRRTLSDEIWLSGDQALSLVVNSRWAQSRRRSAAKPRNKFVYDSFMYDNPTEREMDRKFRSWCNMALEKFESEEPTGRRTVSEAKNYNEETLRAWLSARYDEEVISDFGPP